MLVTLIAAVSDDGIIAQAGRIPWALPRDVAHFRRYCAGKWLLLGRRTYQEMTGWFTDHHPLVLSRREDFVPAVGQRVASVAAALEVAQKQGAEELVVVGGGEIFTLALPCAQQLILTHVHTKVGYGTRFPRWSEQDWRCVQRTSFPADPQHAFAITIAIYQRIIIQAPDQP
jgi:dihydrofolate reductase